MPSTWPELDGITEQMLWLDLVGYLPDDILTKLDRAAMSTSLETRVPFLDRAVFDFAWRLPSVDEARATAAPSGSSGRCSTGTCRGSWWNGRRWASGSPSGPMLLGSLRPWAEELLGERRLEDQGLLDPAPIRRAWQQHLTGRRDLAHELWAVLALQAWLDRWTPDLGR